MRKMGIEHQSNQIKSKKRTCLVDKVQLRLKSSMNEKEELSSKAVAEEASSSSTSIPTSIFILSTALFTFSILLLDLYDFFLINFFVIYLSIHFCYCSSFFTFLQPESYNLPNSSFHLTRPTTQQLRTPARPNFIQPSTQPKRLRLNPCTIKLCAFMTLILF